MLFNSIEFIIFLPIVFVLYWLLANNRKAQNFFVLIASYAFYGCWSWKFLLLIAFTSLCSFVSGLLMEMYEGDRSRQKWISAANIVIY